MIPPAGAERDRGPGQPACSPAVLTGTSGRVTLSCISERRQESRTPREVFRPLRAGTGVSDRQCLALPSQNDCFTRRGPFLKPSLSQFLFPHSLGSPKQRFASRGPPLSQAGGPPRCAEAAPPAGVTPPRVPEGGAGAAAPFVPPGVVRCARPTPSAGRWRRRPGPHRRGPPTPLARARAASR